MQKREYFMVVEMETQESQEFDALRAYMIASKSVLLY